MNRKIKTQRFFKRNPKVLLATSKTQIVIPFKPVSLILILILVGLSIFLALRSDIFLVHSIKVKGVKDDSCLTKEDAINSLALLGRSIIFVSREKASAKITADFLCIKKVNIQKKWPDKIVAEFIYREPLSILATYDKENQNNATDSSNLNQATSAATFSYRYFIIDDEGFIFEKIATPVTNLPLLYSKTQVEAKIGNKIEVKSLKVAAEIISRLSDLQLIIKNANVDQNSIEVDLNDFSAFFSADIDPNYQTSSLQAIIRQSKIDGKHLAKVDLRFDKPVVKFR